MNEEEREQFKHCTYGQDGAIVVTYTLVSQSILDDAVFDSASYLAGQSERAAREFYDDPDCNYHYLTPDEYEYSPGPFDYRHMPGDFPEGIVLMIGRVRIARKA